MFDFAPSSLDLLAWSTTVGVGVYIGAFAAQAGLGFAGRALKRAYRFLRVAFERSK